MLSLKSILKLRNGAAPGAGEIAAQIEQLELEARAAESEIKSLNDAEPALLVEYDLKKLDELQLKRKAQERILQKVEITLPMLRQHLVAARDVERQANWNPVREAIVDVEKKKLAAARAFSALCKESAELRAAGCRAGFALQIQDIPNVPSIFNAMEHPLITVETQALALDHYENNRAKVPLAPTPVPVRDNRAFHFDSASSISPWIRPSVADATPRGAPGSQHAVHLFETPQARDAPAPPTPAPAKRPKPQPRTPRRDTADNGQVLAEILVSGWPDEAGRQCSVGDVVAFSAEAARAAAQRGAVKLERGESQ